MLMEIELIDKRRNNMDLNLNSINALKSLRKTFSSSTTNGDIIDMDNGTMTISRKNISYYLEKYACKDEIELNDTLWYNYGVFLRVVD